MKYYRGAWTQTWLGQRVIRSLRTLQYRWRTRRGARVDITLFWRMVRRRQYRESVRWDSYLRRDVCCYCFRRYPEASMTVEHVVPQGRGGLDRSSNKVGCCRQCNQQRGAFRLIIYLLKRRGHLPKRVWDGTRLRTEHRALDRHQVPPLRTPLRELARWK